MQLKGTAALVTGAGSGIGKAAALLLAREGARVAAVGRTADALEATVGEIAAQGGEAIALPADIAEPEQIHAAVEAAAERFGRLDTVFANAGINGVWAPIEELSPADFAATVNVNLTGTFLTIKYAVPRLKERGGSIIITSSVNGTRIFSNSGATAYSCTKAAQVAMAKMLALELARSKIRVNVICPGWIETEISDSTEQRSLDKIRIPVEYPAGSQPLTGDKPGRPEQVAQLVLFLASDAASHITGTEVWIDGAASLLQG